MGSKIPVPYAVMRWIAVALLFLQWSAAPGPSALGEPVAGSGIGSPERADPSILPRAFDDAISLHAKPVQEPQRYLPAGGADALIATPLVTAALVRGEDAASSGHKRASPPSSSFQPRGPPLLA